jgi:hypothetical protein
MRTLLIRENGIPPTELREIVRGGSTELHEADELRTDAAAAADRVVIWRGGEVEVRGGGDARGDAADRMRWPDDADKLRMFFQTSA